MFDKERTVPEKIVSMKILLGRLPEDHEKRPIIESELSNREAGYKGEKDADFYLRQLPKEKFRILNGLRLEVDGEAFQMDTLILTLSYAIIVEIKNLAYKIIYDTIHDQFLQELPGGSQKRYDNPLNQAERQRLCLNKWLYQHGFPPIPIHTLVVNSNPRTILKTSPEKPNNKLNIFNVENLPKQILKIDAGYYKEALDHDILKSLIKALKKAHTPPTYDLLKEYKISYDELIKGVPCPQCGYCPMERQYGCWSCARCQCRSKTAHEPAINNYLVLVKPTITNSECREWLGIESEDLA
ncbi:MAG: nuclease-related domain-containing protein, partial [Tuberibacillus sp.]